MAALLVALIIGSVLVFWNTHSFIEYQGRSPGFKEIFSLNVVGSDRRAFGFVLFVFLCFLIYGVGSFFISGRGFWNDLKSNFDDFFLVLLFLSVLVNYLVRMVAMGSVERAHSDSQVHVWDVWKVSAKRCKNHRVAAILRCSNVVSALILLVFFVVKLVG